MRLQIWFVVAPLALASISCNSAALPARPSEVSTIVASTAGGTLGARDASSSTTVVSIPATFTVRPSAKAAIQACVGESLVFDGTARLVAHQTMLSDGSVVLDSLHFNGQGAVAVGQSTGTIYRLAGADTNPIVLPVSGGLTATFDANLLVIGPGTAASFMGHVIEHITITPDGTITALIDFGDVDCR